LELDELDHTDPDTTRTMNRLANWEGMCGVRGSYDQQDPARPNRSEHFYVAYDHDLAAGGRDAWVGAHLVLDQEKGTLQAALSDQPMASLAENWLIGRGADADRLRQRLRRGEYDPADTATEEVEELLRHHGERFEPHDSVRATDGPPHETWMIATDAEAPDPPAAGGRVPRPPTRRQRQLHPADRSLRDGRRRLRVDRRHQRPASAGGKPRHHTGPGSAAEPQAHRR